MGLKLYFFSLISIILISFGLSLLLISNVNPFQAPFWVVGIFYLMIFLFLLGIFAIFGYYFKVWRSNREVIFAHLAPTLRQSAIFSLILVGLLFLEQIRVLNWWIASLFVISLLMLELFFRSKK